MYIEVPKKAGKSELAAAVALYLLCADGEKGAEVYGCAADKAQAGIVYNVAIDMVKQDKSLKRRTKAVPSQKRLEFKETGSFYQVVSADVPNKHGLNVHGVIFDELHAQPNRGLYDVMLHGSGDARRQPLYFMITTAGIDRNSICWEVHQKAKDIQEGRKINPSFYSCIYGLDDGDDWTKEENWYKANPSLGVTVKIEKLRESFQEAQENIAEENLFRQLRLNEWVRVHKRWMPMTAWDECGESIDIESLRGRTCYGGLDLSANTDLTAFVLVFPPIEDGEKYKVLPFFWLPEESLRQRVKRDHVPYDIWKRKGLIKTTEGNVVDYDFIEQFIDDLRLEYNLNEIAVDLWNAHHTITRLTNKGFTMIPFRQGVVSFNSPTKELMRVVLEKKLAHGGHEVLRWMMDNVFVTADAAGNIKPDKQKSTEKIDGAVALIMALDRALRNENGGSKKLYDGRDLLLL